MELALQPDSKTIAVPACHLMQIVNVGSENLGKSQYDCLSPMLSDLADYHQLCPAAVALGVCAVQLGVLGLVNLEMFHRVPCSMKTVDSVDHYIHRCFVFDPMERKMQLLACKPYNQHQTCPHHMKTACMLGLQSLRDLDQQMLGDC
jgi:hypothetical protein